MQDFKGKKVLIMGLGLHGGGVSVALWMHAAGARVRITDRKTRKELAASIRRLPRTGIRYTLGKHDAADFLWADVVVQNPGVPASSKYLAIARKNGVVIENEATLFFKIIGRSRIIGVTGTRGKSTTTTLIHSILRKKYPRSVLGGNIASHPMFSVINEARQTSDPVVLELSSWHLENLGEDGLSPHVAVFTNLMPDHLNRYKTMKEYFEAKRNIIAHQKPGDIAVLPAKGQWSDALRRGSQSDVILFSTTALAHDGAYIKKGEVVVRMRRREERVLSLDRISVPGEHNRQNILAAVAAARSFGVGVRHIARAIREFTGLKNRQEIVGKAGGITYVNDTTATTPDAAIAAIRSFGSKQKKNIILIAGGSDKNIGQERFTEFARHITKYCKGAVLFEGKGSDKIRKGLREVLGRQLEFQMCAGITSMPDAFGVAKSWAVSGDIILLSPACASFGLFVHEFDRGDRFNSLVKNEA